MNPSMTTEEKLFMLMAEAEERSEAIGKLVSAMDRQKAELSGLSDALHKRVTNTIEDKLEGAGPAFAKAAKPTLEALRSAIDDAKEAAEAMKGAQNQNAFLLSVVLGFGGMILGGGLVLFASPASAEFKELKQQNAILSQQIKGVSDQVRAEAPIARRRQKLGP